MQEGSAKAFEKNQNQQSTVSSNNCSPSFLVWLRTWRQVIIAELLQVMEGRRRHDA